MLIKAFRSGYVIKIFMFLIISLLLWLGALLNPSAIADTSTYGIAYDYLVSLINLPDRIFVIIAFLLLLLQAVIFNSVLVENPLFSKSVFLPALIYVILMSYNPAHLTLHPALIANYFLIFSLKNLYNTYGKKESLREAFNASFWLAAASLFHLPAAFMLLLIWVSFLIFRVNTWREWLISVIGFCTPYLILFTGFYLYDGLETLVDYYPDDLSWIRVRLSINMLDYIFWPAFLLLLMIAYIKFTIERSEKIISIRKSFAVVNAFLLISAGTVFTSGADPHMHAYLMFPAAAVIVSYFFIETKRRVLAEILFLILLVAIAIIKFI